MVADFASGPIRCGLLNWTRQIMPMPADAVATSPFVHRKLGTSRSVKVARGIICGGCFMMLTFAASSSVQRIARTTVASLDHTCRREACSRKVVSCLMCVDVQLSTWKLFRLSRSIRISRVQRAYWESTFGEGPGLGSATAIRARIASLFVEGMLVYCYTMRWTLSLCQPPQP